MVAIAPQTRDRITLAPAEGLQMSQKTATPEHTPRRRGRIILWVALLVIVGLVLAHLAWSNHERHKLMAAIERYRQAGEPVLPEDFTPAANDDPDNPVPQWRSAAASLQGFHTKLADHIDRTEFSVPLSDSEDSLLRQLLDQNQLALSRAATAGEMHGRPDWRIKFASPTISTLLPDLNAQRQLARMLNWAALDAHHRHDDAEAAQRFLQILSQAKALQNHPSLVGHLVAIGIEAIGCELARTIGPDMQIGAAPDGSGHPASVAQIKQLIALLLDDRPLREGQVLAYRTERMFEVDTVLEVASGQLTIEALTSRGPSDSNSKKAQAILGYLLSPQIYGDGRLMLDQTTNVLKAAQAPDWPTSQARMAALPDLKGKRRFGHVMLSILMPAFERAVTQDFRLLTDKRLTALMLACRRYAVDHGGKFPDKLDDLVPNYLPAIPADPFATGAPLRYRGGANPVVYSIGENGTDDSGSEQPIDPRRKDDRWQQMDVVTHLTLQPHTAPPDNIDDADDTPTTQPTAAPTSAPIH
jgi:hypothetical protein